MNGKIARANLIAALSKIKAKGAAGFFRKRTPNPITATLKKVLTSEELSSIGKEMIQQYLQNIFQRMS